MFTTAVFVALGIGFAFDLTYYLFLKSKFGQFIQYTVENVWVLFIIVVYINWPSRMIASWKKLIKYYRIEQTPEGSCYKLPFLSKVSGDKCKRTIAYLFGDDGVFLSNVRFFRKSKKHLFIPWGEIESVTYDGDALFKFEKFPKIEIILYSIPEDDIKNVPTRKLIDWNF